MPIGDQDELVKLMEQLIHEKSGGKTSYGQQNQNGPTTVRFSAARKSLVYPENGTTEERTPIATPSNSAPKLITAKKSKRNPAEDLLVEVNFILFICYMG